MGDCDSKGNEKQSNGGNQIAMRPDGHDLVRVLPSTMGARRTIT
jgi:hypothetical protein